MTIRTIFFINQAQTDHEVFSTPSPINKILILSLPSRNQTHHHQTHQTKQKLRNFNRNLNWPITERNILYPFGKIESLIGLEQLKKLETLNQREYKPNNH